MSYDPGLAERLAENCAIRPGMDERKMFGGIFWMLHGNMCAGVFKDWLIIRVGVERAQGILKEPCAKEMDITGSVMKGWVMIDSVGLQEDCDLDRYVQHAVEVKSQFCCNFPLQVLALHRIQWLMPTTLSFFRLEGCCASHHS
ncbi:MAG: RNA methyltransferase [Gammaproteobacteria bacterium]|nr:MAG: RNA methyltransferase [Gammaproteobacteria bacterium]